MELKKPISITSAERSILEILAKAYEPDEWGAYAFASLGRQTNLDAKQVRRACRSLARKGLAAYERSLWNDDGPAGAGYRATEDGAALINPCDVCPKRATYDYHVDANGETAWLPKDTHRHIRECNDHYQSQRQQSLKV